MNQFEMVAFIVLVVSIAGVLRVRFLNPNKRADDSLAKQQEARIAKLEERVKALETVVGDKHYDLRQQFKDL